jgi:predicted membrane channel-forming protein YqfA (hemolysin III family)
VLLGILLFSTDPNRIPSFMLILPFVLLGVALSAGIAFVLERRGVPRLRSLRLGIFLTALPIVLLVFQSIGQLTTRDVVTILALFVISYFYAIRIHAKTE